MTQIQYDVNKEILENNPLKNFIVLTKTRIKRQPELFPKIVSQTFYATTEKDDIINSLNEKILENKKSLFWNLINPKWIVDYFSNTIYYPSNSNSLYTEYNEEKCKIENKQLHLILQK